MAKSKILVTGGAGFIGSHLVEKLAAKDEEVVVLDNLTTGNYENLLSVADKIEFMKADILDESALSKAMKNVSIVYHLAAEVGVDYILKRPKKTQIVNYVGTKKVLEAAVKEGAKKFLFASSSEVYGKSNNGNAPLREEAHFKPTTQYGKTKLESEKLCKKISKINGISVICVRYFNIFGPRQTMNGYCVPKFVDAALKDKEILIHGDGTQTRDFTYIDDAVKLTMAVCDDKFDRQVFNISTGVSISINDLAKKIIELSNSRSKIRYIPKRRPTDRYSKCGNSSKIFRATGLNVRVSLEDGLMRYIVSYCRALEDMKKEAIEIKGGEI